MVADLNENKRGPVKIRALGDELYFGVSGVISGKKESDAQKVQNLNFISNFMER
jgi:hypothetical protein